MKKLIAISLLLSTFCGCTENAPMVSLGLDEVYYLARMQKLQLRPALSGERYRWTVNGVEQAASHDFIFLGESEGEYSLSFEIIDDATPFRHDFTIYVLSLIPS